jgi:diguanylate cyclase (GGDEF)-like protein
MSSPINALERLFGADRRAPATPPPDRSVASTATSAKAAASDPLRDPLTGHFNATGIEAELMRAIAEASASGETVAVGYVGLDGLREIDEEYGRLISDQIVREIGARVGEVVRENDIVGRCTVNEFFIVFRGLAGRLEALALASRLRMHLGDPMRAGRIVYEPLASCGMAYYPADGSTTAELRTKAESAMQQMLVATREAVERKRREDAERAVREAAEREAESNRVAASEATVTAERVDSIGPASAAVEAVRGT